MLCYIFFINHIGRWVGKRNSSFNSKDFSDVFLSICEIFDNRKIDIHTHRDPALHGLDLVYKAQATDLKGVISTDILLST